MWLGAGKGGWFPPTVNTVQVPLVSLNGRWETRTWGEGWLYVGFKLHGCTRVDHTREGERRNSPWVNRRKEIPYKKGQITVQSLRELCWMTMNASWLLSNCFPESLLPLLLLLVLLRLGSSAPPNNNTPVCSNISLSLASTAACWT